jgi:hypothetical protein
MLSLPIKLMSSTLRSITLPSKPEPPRKLLHPTPPGKPDMTVKRDFQKVPQEKPGLPICQTTLLKSQISISEPQHHLVRSSPKPRKKKLRLKEKHQPRKLKLPQHSSNFPEELKSFPKRELLKAQNHLNHPAQIAQTPLHLIPIEIQKKTNE